MKLLKITSLFFYLIFLNGCFHATALLGPSFTIVTTGNIMQAGFQYGANSAIKNETGKDTLEHIRDAVEDENKSRKLKLKYTEIIQKKIQNMKQKNSTN